MLFVIASLSDKLENAMTESELGCFSKNREGRRKSKFIHLDQLYFYK